MRKGCIYLLSNPQGLQYVGHTFTDLKTELDKLLCRYEKYKTGKGVKTCAFKVISDYDKSDLTIEVLEEVIVLNNTCLVAMKNELIQKQNIKVVNGGKLHKPPKVVGRWTCPSCGLETTIGCKNKHFNSEVCQIKSKSIKRKQNQKFVEWAKENDRKLYKAIRQHHSLLKQEVQEIPEL